MFGYFSPFTSAQGAWGIVVDTDTDKAWGIVVDTDSSSFNYYADQFSAPTSVTCSTIDPTGDFVKCMIAGHEDKAWGIVVDDGDGLPTPRIEQGDKAWGIVVDETDSLLYYGESTSVFGQEIDCLPLGSAGDYQLCNVNGDSKPFGIVSEGDGAWGIVVDESDSKAWGIVVDETDSYTYIADPMSTPVSVNCSAVDVNGDYLICNINGEDKAWGIVVDEGDGLPSQRIEQDSKAWGIVVDESDAVTYYGNGGADFGGSMTCTVFDALNEYMACPTTDESWGLQGFIELQF